MIVTKPRILFTTLIRNSQQKMGLERKIEHLFSRIELQGDSDLVPERSQSRRWRHKVVAKQEVGRRRRWLDFKMNFTKPRKLLTNVFSVSFFWFLLLLFLFQVCWLKNKSCVKSISAAIDILKLTKVVRTIVRLREKFIMKLRTSIKKPKVKSIPKKIVK